MDSESDIEGRDDHPHIYLIQEARLWMCDSPSWGGWGDNWTQAYAAWERAKRKGRNSFDCAVWADERYQLKGRTT